MDEYIKREAAIAAINKFKGPTRSPDQNNLLWGSVKLVERIPAADVVLVRHGRWKDSKNYKGSLFWCSICNNSDLWKSNYCPNCGAKMDGEEAEEDKRRK